MGIVHLPNVLALVLRFQRFALGPRLACGFASNLFTVLAGRLVRSIFQPCRDLVAVPIRVVQE
jgi:hypothetical protein